MLIKKRIRSVISWINFITLLVLFTAILFLYTDYSAQLPLKITLLVVVTESITFEILGRRVRVFVNTDKSQYSKGEMARLCLQINKRSFYPFKFIYIVVNYQNRYSNKKFKKTLKIELSDNNKITCYQELDYLLCGYTDISIKDIYMYDLLGFMNLKLHQKYKKVSILTLPVPKGQAVDLNDIPFINGDEEFLFKNENEKNSSMEILEIREFRDGDSLNKVHWKLSGKADELMVREFINPNKTDIYVYVDLSLGNSIESVLEKAVTFSYQLCNLKYPFYITWYDSLTMKLLRMLILNDEDIEICFTKILNYPLFTDSEENKEVTKKLANDSNIINTIFRIQ